MTLVALSMMLVIVMAILSTLHAASFAPVILRRAIERHIPTPSQPDYEVWFDDLARTPKLIRLLKAIRMCDAVQLVEKLELNRNIQQPLQVYSRPDSATLNQQIDEEFVNNLPPLTYHTVAAIFIVLTLALTDQIAVAANASTFLMSLIVFRLFETDAQAERTVGSRHNLADERLRTWDLSEVRSTANLRLSRSFDFFIAWIVFGILHAFLVYQLLG